MKYSQEKNTMTQQITVVPGSLTELPAIVDLILQQETRLQALDPHLRDVRRRDLIEASLIHQVQGPEQPLVAHDGQGRVRGYVQPAVWNLPQSSLLHAFLTPHNGIAQNLTLPAPAEEDASLVTAALLAALSTSWTSRQTTGDLLRWASHDTWVEPTFFEQGFLLDSVCAYTRHPPIPSGRSLPPSFRIRTAQPEDEEAVVGLFQEELQFHEACVPFAHLNQEALQAFRRKLVRFWECCDLSDGAQLVLVIEREGQVVAMAESTLLDVSLDDEPGFTPSGRYGCIDNMSVAEQVRGQGIGRLLAQAVFAAFAHLQLDGYILWYNPGNALADQFWPRLGFQPLWTTYQRLRSASGSA
jgi:GNAT superfamily N-acetyltransferase